MALPRFRPCPTCGADVDVHAFRRNRTTCAKCGSVLRMGFRGDLLFNLFVGAAALVLLPAILVLTEHRSVLLFLLGLPVATLGAASFGNVFVPLARVYPVDPVVEKLMDKLVGSMIVFGVPVEAIILRVVFHFHW